MTSTVRRSVAVLALAAALGTAACGASTADRAAVVDGTVIRETDLQAAMSEINGMDPALLQEQLTPTGTLTALVQAPVVLDYLAGKGVVVSDSVASREAADRGVAEPSEGTLQVIKFASAISAAQESGQLTEPTARRSRSSSAPRTSRSTPATAPSTRTPRRSSSASPRGSRRSTQASDRLPVTVGALGLLLTSPRVAPGLLSHSAWEAVRSSTVRLARTLDDPLVEALQESGFGVQDVGDVSPPELARRLVDLATAASVLWLGSSDGDPGLADAIAAEVSRLESPPDVEVVVGSWDVQGGRLLDVVATMDRLRSPGGCPWDAEQTHETLSPYLVEEAHEVVYAIATGDRAHLAEELGDVLLQVVFHARVAEEAEDGAFDIDTVAGLLVDKLVRRHPHVFGDGDATTPAGGRAGLGTNQGRGEGSRCRRRRRRRPPARHPRLAARRPGRGEGALQAPAARPHGDAVDRGCGGEDRADLASGRGRGPRGTAPSRRRGRANRRRGLVQQLAPGSAGSPGAGRVVVRAALLASDVSGSGVAPLLGIGPVRIRTHITTPARSTKENDPHVAHHFPSPHRLRARRDSPPRHRAGSPRHGGPGRRFRRHRRPGDHQLSRRFHHGLDRFQREGVMADTTEGNGGVNGLHRLRREGVSGGMDRERQLGGFTYSTEVSTLPQGSSGISQDATKPSTPTVVRIDDTIEYLQVGAGVLAGAALVGAGVAVASRRNHRGLTPA